MINKRILTFGTLTKAQGGKLTTGLSTVIWKIAYNISSYRSIENSLFAVDFYQEKKYVDDLEILGWTKKNLILQILKNPISSLKHFFVSLFLFYRYNLKIIRSFVYMVLFDRIIKLKQPDIIHIHGTYYIYFHFMPKEIREKIIITVHGINGFDKNIVNYLNQQKIEKIITETCFKHIVFVSTQLCNDWIKFYGKTKSDTHIIINAYDNQIFKYKQPEKFENKNKIIITTVARIYPLKGQERVIKALAEFEDKETIQYHIVGKGENSYVENLKKQAFLNKVEVFFHGEKDAAQIVDILSFSDYMILPSSSEGFGIAYLESIACGTKVIIPKDLPICKEPNLLNNINSIFINDSSINSITKGLRLLKNDVKYSKVLVSLSLGNLNWKEVTDKYLDLLK
ncbi:MAG: glycosyltransferase [Mobilitalea sp.]